MDDDPHLSQIQTIWSMVRCPWRLTRPCSRPSRRCSIATAAQSAAMPCRPPRRRRGRRSLPGIRPAIRPRRFQRAPIPASGRFRAFVKTVVYRLIVDYQRRKKKHHREGPMHSNMAEPLGELDAADQGSDDAMFQASWRDELLGPLLGETAELRKGNWQTIPHGAPLSRRTSRSSARRSLPQACAKNSASRSTRARSACCCIGRATNSPTCCWTRSPIARRRLARRGRTGADRTGPVGILQARPRTPPRKEMNHNVTTSTTKNLFLNGSY